jgi:hypothetical protein
MMDQPAGVSPAVSELLKNMPLAPLGPGRPEQAWKSELQTLDDNSFGGANPDRAAACRAALWLAFGFLDESHTISQGLETAEGSYWHALMHRREPDASNAAYWFRRVGEHAIFPALRREAQDLGMRLGSDSWSPFDFIDLCERHRGSGTEQEMLLRRVQKREWELLFDWCLRAAGGKG